MLKLPEETEEKQYFINKLLTLAMVPPEHSLAYLLLSNVTQDDEQKQKYLSKSQEIFSSEITKCSNSEIDTTSTQELIGLV